MPAKKTVLISFLSALFVGLVQAEEVYKIARYKVIVDRSPFGEEPLVAAATPQTVPSATVANLEKKYRLAFLFKSDTGEIRAGFQNLHPQKGESTSSVILIGESFAGMKLKAVDLSNSIAKLEYNGKPLSFTLKKATQKPHIAKTNRRHTNRNYTRKPRKINRPRSRPKLSPEEQRKRREEIRKNLQKYQMEVLRKGMPPLPIRLTPEQDAKLVEEQVLPPLN